jgi:hypothetical protein
MIALLKKLFRKEHPADLVTNEAIDIIKRYQRFTEQERKQLLSAFGFAKAGLELKHGEINTWALTHKAAVAEELAKAAKEGYAYAPYGSCGVALVGLYLEAQTISGEKAKRLVCLIDEWHRRVMATDLQAGSES